MARIFFAVWPESAAAGELAEVAQALGDLAGGKPQPVEKIHMTLAFLGSLDPEAAGSAVTAAATVRAGEIRMTIDAVGSFRRSRVGWAAPSEPSVPLADLRSKLADALRLRGFTLEDRAFTPHVTLLRKIARPIPRAPMAPIEWRSRAFTLVETTGDGRYEILESWGLDPGSRPRSRRPG